MHNEGQHKRARKSGQASGKLRIVFSSPLPASLKWSVKTLFHIQPGDDNQSADAGSECQFARRASDMARRLMEQEGVAPARYSFAGAGFDGELTDITQTPAERRHILILAADADLTMIGIDGVSGVSIRDFEDITRAALAGIYHLVILVAVDDAPDASERFDGIASPISDHCADLEFGSVACIAIPAGDPGSAEKPSWYEGNSLPATLHRIARLTAARREEKAKPVETGHMRKSDQFAVHLFGAGEKPVLPGRSYSLICNGQEITAAISTLKHKINLQTLEHLACRRVHSGEIAYGNLSLSEPISFTPFDEDHDQGGCVLIDKISGQQVALAVIRFDLWRSSNVHWQQLDIDKKARADLKKQTPGVLWFTGLSGSGKSTIANLLEKKLYAMGKHTCLLDGDNVRHGLCRDLGFTEADRVENIRRIAETAKLMADAGLLVITSFISPFRSERRMARQLIGGGEFVEIFIDTSLEICEERDTKGLYKKARAGLIRNFTGLDSPYEVPERPDICLDGSAPSIEQLVDQVIEDLARRKLI